MVPFHYKVVKFSLYQQQIGLNLCIPNDSNMLNNLCCVAHAQFVEGLHFSAFLVRWCRFLAGLLRVVVTDRQTDTQAKYYNPRCA